MEENNQIVREAVGVFDDLNHMQEAISELENAGFSRHTISVLGSEYARKEVFGTEHVKAKLLEDNPYTPRSQNIRVEELGIGQGVLIGGGMLAGVIIGMVIALTSSVDTLPFAALIGGATGTAVGGGFAKLLGDKYAEFFQNQVKDGGLLLWVSTPTRKMEKTAKNVLRKHGAHDVHMHEMPVKA